MGQRDAHRETIIRNQYIFKKILKLQERSKAKSWFFINDNDKPLVRQIRANEREKKRGHKLPTSGT